MAPVEEKVIELVAARLNVTKEAFTNKTHFANDFGVDSLDIIDLVMDFEEEFNIDIPNDVVIETIGQVIALVEKEIAEK